MTRAVSAADWADTRFLSALATAYPGQKVQETALASKAQLRMSLLRWTLVTVPLILLLGTLSGKLAGSDSDNAWYAALAKPELTPEGWVFPVAWALL